MVGGDGRRPGTALSMEAEHSDGHEDTADREELQSVDICETLLVTCTQLRALCAQQI